jgi:CTP:molybdopterin cytidylyltransferase MocA
MPEGRDPRAAHSNTRPRPVAAVVLAAGEASRFGRPKQAVLLPHVLGRLARAHLDDIVVVLGAYPVAVADVRTVTSTDWERGPGASLRAGLSALGPEIEAAVVCLADGPLIAPEAIDRVVGAWLSGAGDVVAASYGGDRGHPLVLGRSVWGSVPDDGGRSLTPVLVPCDDLGAPEDVDTEDDLRRVEGRIAANAN